MQVGRAHLHGCSAERERCGDAAASAIPPAAMTGTFTASATCGTSARAATAAQ